MCVLGPGLTVPDAYPSKNQTIVYFTLQLSRSNRRLRLIQHVRDFSDAEYLEIPNYWVIFSLIAKCTSVAVSRFSTLIAPYVNIIFESASCIFWNNLKYIKLKLL